jgi:hypothetical protein
MFGPGVSTMPEETSVKARREDVGGIAVNCESDADV